LRSLWAKLQPFAWEAAAAKEYVESDEVLKLLDYPSYFRLLDRTLPDNRDGIFEQLKNDKLIEPDVGGRWNITNLGAILFAMQLDRERDEQPTAFGVDGIATALSVRTFALPASA
jgi:predicted HTH transcriptional regulator